MRLLPFVVIATCVATTAPQEAANATIASYIHRQAERERGEEHEEARMIVSGDLNGDGQPESVVLYTIESQGGSDNYFQYLAVFSRRSGALTPIAQARVGGKSRRSVSLRSVEHLAIELDTLDYAPADASCCPSVSGTTTYALVGGELRENRPRPR